MSDTTRDTPTLAAVAIVVGTVAVAATTPPPIATLAIGGVALAAGTILTARPDHLTAAVVGTAAVATLVGTATLGGWAWTTTLWGTALALSATTALMAYLLHRYTVALTEGPP